jgi:sortase (surface protein transpeptidase)
VIVAASEPAEVASAPEDARLELTTNVDTQPIRARPAAVVPTLLRIPEIGVEATIVDLGLTEDQELEVPSDFDQTGWYTGRATPGDPGPAVVVGHVDSTTGPAVFFRLGELAPGDVVEIDRSDGLTARYRVTALGEADKDAFPVEAVYGTTEAPTLRLITCGGEFDHDAGSYVGNVIVYAEHLGNEPMATPPT